MKVILKEDVQNLGQQGDVVEVKPGYARNYLMPHKLAILFTKQKSIAPILELSKEVLCIPCSTRGYKTLGIQS